MIDVIIKVWAFIVSLIPHWTVVVDTETTSLHESELLQVSLISGSGRVLFSRYIKPDEASEWPEAQKINHISPRMVKRCRHFSTYAPLVNAYLRHCKTLIGYNLKGFDLPILNGYGICTHANVVDIMLDDARKRTKPGESDARWRKLYKVARGYGYVFMPHDALEDCLATLHIHVFMHPGINTVLYFLRKVARVIVGIVLIWLVSVYQQQIQEYSPLSSSVALYLIIASWSYVYGPITAGLTTIIGVSLYFAGTESVVILLALAVVLGLLYMITGIPVMLTLKLVICVLMTIIGGAICLIGVPAILNHNWPLSNAEMTEIMNLILITACGSPLYLFLKRFLKRVL